MSRPSKNWSIANFGVILFLLTAGLIFLGEQFRLPKASELGTACLGLLIVSAGINTIHEHRDVFQIDGWSRERVVETYQGLAEWLWGFIFICVGLGVASLGLMQVFLPASADTFWENVLGSTTGIGAILAVVGLMMVLNGLIRTLAGSSRPEARPIGWLTLVLDRLAGAGTFLFGGAVSLIGLVLLIAPGAVTAGIEALKVLVIGS